MFITAIDPGPEQSAYVIYDTVKKLPLEWAKLPNASTSGLDIRSVLEDPIKTYKVVIEMVGCYGMPVGREIFETCVWIGRFIELAEKHRRKVVRIERGDIKLHICNSKRAKDSNIIQAIKDRYGGNKLAKGHIQKKGPLYGFKADCWQALAVALTYADLHVEEL